MCIRDRLDCGLKKDQFTINVSNRKIVQGLIDDLKISEEKQVKVIRAIDKLDKPGFGLKGVEDLLKKERKDISGAITKGADLNDEQACSSFKSAPLVIAPLISFLSFLSRSSTPFKPKPGLSNLSIALITFTCFSSDIFKSSINP